MPIPAIHGNALGDEKSLMPQVFSDNTAGSLKEDQRRRVTPQVQAAPAKKPVNLQPASGSTPISKPPVAPQDVIDRVHKESGNKYGGYVIVGQDHDASETDQMPPSNPGWRTPNVTASSIADAYSKAQTMQAIANKPYARIAIIILGGTWNESPLFINTPGIDICGIGQPTIFGDITVQPGSDARLRDFDYYGQLFLMPYPTDNTSPRPVPSSLYNIRGYKDDTCFISQRRLYMQDCEFYQTADQASNPTETAAMRMHSTGPQSGFCVLKNCKAFAYYDYSAFGTYGIKPKGFAIQVIGTGGGGSFVIRGDWYIQPSTGVVLDQCEVYGSLINDYWTVQHKGGRVHGGIPIPTHAGNTYLRSRGLPLFDTIPNYYGSEPAYTTFDNTTIHSERIGEFVVYNGSYPTGIMPTSFPGINYVAVRHCPHLNRYDGPVAEPFVVFGFSSYIPVVDIVNSSTPGPTWNTTNTTTTIYGTCPANVFGNRDFFMM